MQGVESEGGSRGSSPHGAEVVKNSQKLYHFFTDFHFSKLNYASKKSVRK